MYVCIKAFQSLIGEYRNRLCVCVCKQACVFLYVTHTKQNPDVRVELALFLQFTLLSVLVTLHIRSPWLHLSHDLSVGSLHIVSMLGTFDVCHVGGMASYEALHSHWSHHCVCVKTFYHSENDFKKYHIFGSVGNDLAASAHFYNFQNGKTFSV